MEAKSAPAAKLFGGRLLFDIVWVVHLTTSHGVTVFAAIATEGGRANGGDCPPFLRLENHPRYGHYIN
eukprot:scaffold544_cov66-Skeletonema_marinoi.AAC.1